LRLLHALKVRCVPYHTMFLIGNLASESTEHACNYNEVHEGLEK
jgi:hypothetical protein